MNLPAKRADCRGSAPSNRRTHVASLARPSLLPSLDGVCLSDSVGLLLPPLHFDPLRPLKRRRRNSCLPFLTDIGARAHSLPPLQSALGSGGRGGHGGPGRARRARAAHDCVPSAGRRPRSSVRPPFAEGGWFLVPFFRSSPFSNHFRIGTALPLRCTGYVDRVITDNVVGDDYDDAAAPLPW